MVAQAASRLRWHNGRMTDPTASNPRSAPALPWLAVVSLAMFGAALAAALRVLAWRWSLPVAWPGAKDMPVADAFNALAFVVPGALLAVQAVRFRLHVGNAWPRAVRQAAWMWLVAALAFGALGFARLDPTDLDGAGSQWHSALWALWWIAAALAGFTASIGCRGAGRVACILLALAVLAGARWLPAILDAGAAQAFAVVAWMAWPLVFAGRAARWRPSSS